MQLYERLYSSVGPFVRLSVGLLVRWSVGPSVGVGSSSEETSVIEPCAV